MRIFKRGASFRVRKHKFPPWPMPWGKLFTAIQHGFFRWGKAFLRSDTLCIARENTAAPAEKDR